MGAIVTTIVDVILLLFFTIIAVAAPLLDAQTFLSPHYFPEILVDFKLWYAREFGDYLVVDKPHFFVGLVWLELFLQWPLALANIYGILAGKSWLHTTCLIYGVSTFTSMVAILSEIVGSPKSSDKLIKTYAPFIGFATLAILRGLFSQPIKSTIIGRRPFLNRKKKA
ncbi:sigma intracellular receptor 2-like [Impatiens glandulifera]|uniref:sigma intracellular receptor 2-like n=1 Tax=Impatiens glandulifera TaxID=253017 RepID=UPI001FB17B44|nr:sigma intracellular receptor 2-like [Impatiens glandulifera]